jgi:hypothetical protein
LGSLSFQNGQSYRCVQWIVINQGACSKGQLVWVDYASETSFVYFAFSFPTLTRKPVSILAIN